MEPNQTAFAQRIRDKVYFDNPDMDYYLSWIVGRQTFDGAEPGECFATASRIKNGDATSWQTEWARTAATVEEQAQTALAEGELETARTCYLRACTYYRAPLFIMSPHAPPFSGHWEKMHSCFQKATVLFDPPIETIHVPFRQQLLSGYFWKVDNSTRKRPTLVLFGGIETFAEDCYFMTGMCGPQRGYNVMTVDLPGQGMNPAEGLYFGARMDVPVQAVIDYALQRPEIDGERLALFGFSWGGHIVLKGGEADKRVRALVADPPMPDVFRAVLAQQKGHNRNDPIAKIVFEQIVWRMGLRISFDPRDIARRMGKAYDYLVHGKANPRRILCSALLIAGDAEAPITLQIARECYAQLPHPLKKLVIFNREDGTDLHCQVDNPALLNRVMFDWLDGVFT